MPAKNSTIDRILPGAIRGLGWVSPRLQAAVATHLFLRTPPRTTPRTPPQPLPAGRRHRFAAGVVGEIWEAATPEARGTVLLLHGWGGRRTQLYPFVPGFVAAGYRVATFDAPGHGDSPGASLSLVLFAQTVQKVAAELGPLHAIVAHSFGGPAAALAIRDGLVVERLVTIGAPADPSAWFAAFCAYLGFAPDARGHVLAAIEARVGAPMASLAIEAIGPALRLPVLVLHDRLDGEVDYSAAARIVAAAPGARLVTTEGLGHRKILKHASVINDVQAFVLGPTAKTAFEATRCRRCGRSTAGEAWETRLCMSCGVEEMLAHPSDRWPTAA